MTDQKGVRLYVYSMCVCMCVCATSCFKRKSLKVEKTLCPRLLSPLCSHALAAFQSQPGWLRPGHREGEGRAAYDWREAEEILYTQMHTCRRTRFSTGGSSSRAPAQGYKETPLRLSKKTEVALGREGWLNRTDRPTRERNFKQPPGWKDKGKRKEGWEGGEGRAGGHSSCLAYEPLH